MKRYLAFLAVLVGTLPHTGSEIAAVSGRMNQHRVYTVAELQTQLARNPVAWVGRIVRVRGRATACYVRLEHGHFRCVPQQPRLSDPDAGATIAPLLLAWKDLNPALTFMLRVPLLGSLLPAPQAMDWGAVATYRVQLRAMAAGSCPFLHCFEAVLLDAAPGSPEGG